MWPCAFHCLWKVRYSSFYQAHLSRLHHVYMACHRSISKLHPFSLDQCRNTSFCILRTIFCPAKNRVVCPFLAWLEVHSLHYILEEIHPISLLGVVRSSSKTARIEAIHSDIPFYSLQNENLERVTCQYYRGLSLKRSCATKFIKNRKVATASKLSET